MGLAAVGLLLPGLVFDGAGANPTGGSPTEGVKQTIVKYGPFMLPPAGRGGDMDHANVFMPNVPKPCEDCYITRAEPDLVYEDGYARQPRQRADAPSRPPVQHRPARHDLREGHVLRPASGSGSSPRATSAPSRCCRRATATTSARDPVTGVFHIMNHSDETKTVFFTFKIDWLPGSTAGVRPVTPVWLDVANCRTSEYPVPAGPSSDALDVAVDDHRPHRVGPAGTSTPAVTASR